MNSRVFGLLKLLDYSVIVIAALLLATSIISFVLLGPYYTIGLWLFSPHAFTVIIWTSAYFLLRNQFYPFKIFFIVFLWSLHELISNFQYALANLSHDYLWLQVIAIPTWLEYTLILSIAGFISLLIIRDRIAVQKWWLVSLLGLNILFLILGAPNIIDPLKGTVTHANWSYEVIYNIAAMVIYLNLFKDKKVLSKYTKSTSDRAEIPKACFPKSGILDRSRLPRVNSSCCRIGLSGAESPSLPTNQFQS